MATEVKYDWKDWLAFLLPAMVIGGWGCLVLHLYSQGKLGLLQHPRFHGITFGAGVALVLLTLAYPFVKDPEPGQTIGSLARELLKALALLLPIFLIMLFPLNGTSGDWIMNQSYKIRQPPPAGNDATPPKWLTSTNNRAPSTATVLDLIAASENHKWRGMMDGRRVKILGQWVPDDKDKGMFRLVRIFMYCCVADASPVVLKIRGAAPKEPSGNWVWVTGIVKVGPPQMAPVIQLEKIESAPAPKDIFLY